MKKQKEKKWCTQWEDDDEDDDDIMEQVTNNKWDISPNLKTVGWADICTF